MINNHTQAIKSKVLICDDDLGIADVTTLILEAEGYEILVCDDGEDVVDAVKSFIPDMILLDLWMPGPGGKAITKALKGNPDSKNIPIVIVSANKDTPEIATEIGADDHLCKPFDILDLETIVKKYLTKL